MLFINARTDPQRNQLGDVVSEAGLLVGSIRTAIDRAGFRTDDVVRARTYMVDLTRYPSVRPLLAELWGAVFPASTLVQVAALPGGAGIQIDVIAVAQGNAD